MQIVRNYIGSCMTRYLRRRLRLLVPRSQRRTSTTNPAAASTSRVYIPLEHFFAVASQFMPAFLQAASVLGVVPAKAGAATATIRLKAIIDTSAFIYISSDADCTTIQAPKGGVETATQCHAKISRSGILPRCTRDCPEGTRPSKPPPRWLRVIRAVPSLANPRGRFPGHPR